MTYALDDLDSKLVTIYLNHLRENKVKCFLSSVVLNDETLHIQSVVA